MSPYLGLDGEPIGREEWLALWVDETARRVAWTDLPGVEISTVWLGLDHNYGLDGPPLIFETMIFGGSHDQDQWRYPNRDAALAGHDQAVALARDAIPEGSRK